MDEASEAILAEFPGRRSRSRLEPYRDLIRELHRRGCPLKEMSRVMKEKFGVTAAPSTIFRFLERQERTRLKPRKARMGEESPVPATPALPPPSPGAAPPLPPDGGWRRIAALKQRKPEPEPEAKPFQYDPTQPLHLEPKAGQ